MYCSQGSVSLRVKILSSQSCYLEFLYIFERKLAYLFILIGVAEPPKLYGPHAPIIVIKTSDYCT